MRKNHIALLLVLVGIFTAAALIPGVTAQDGAPTPIPTPTPSPFNVVITQPATGGQRLQLTDQGVAVLGSVTFDPSIIKYWKADIRGTSSRATITVSTNPLTKVNAFDWVTLDTTHTDQLVDGQIAYIPAWPNLTEGSWLFRVVGVGYDDTFPVEPVVIPFTVTVPFINQAYINVTRPSAGEVLEVGASNAILGWLEFNQWVGSYKIDLLGGTYTSWSTVDGPHLNDTANPTKIQDGQIGSLPENLPAGTYKLRIIVYNPSGILVQPPTEVTFSVGTADVSNLPQIELTSPRVQHGGTLTITQSTDLIGSVTIPQGAAYYKVDIKDAPNRDRDQPVRFGDWTTLGSLHTQSVAGGVIESISGPPDIGVGRYLLRIVIFNGDGSFVGDPFQINLAVREPGSGGSNAPRPTATYTPRPTRTPVPTPEGTVPQAAQPDGSIIHEVQPRDTLGSIAAAYGVTVAELLELNNIDNPNLITVGQRIVIRRAGG